MVGKKYNRSLIIQRKISNVSKIVVNYNEIWSRPRTNAEAKTSAEMKKTHWECDDIVSFSEKNCDRRENHG